MLFYASCKGVRIIAASLQKYGKFKHKFKRALVFFVRKTLTLKFIQENIFLETNLTVYCEGVIYWYFAQTVLEICLIFSLKLQVS